LSDLWIDFLICGISNGMTGADAAGLLGSNNARALSTSSFNESMALVARLSSSSLVLAGKVSDKSFGVIAGSGGARPFRPATISRASTIIARFVGILFEPLEGFSRLFKLIFSGAQSYGIR
jgi:hypothetical protein